MKYGMTLFSLSRHPRFDGDGGDPPEDKNPPKKPNVEDRVRDELEKRYRPRSVREWLAQYSDNAELALEKAVDMLNDRIQKQIRSETTLGAEKEDLLEQINSLKGEMKTAQQERDDFKGKLTEREAKERSERISNALKKSFPETHEALRLALKDQGYELEIGDKDEIMVGKDDKRHQLKTVLTDDFYKRYPFAKAQDESPFKGDGERADTDFGESVAEEFGKIANKQFSFEEKE